MDLGGGGTVLRFGVKVAVVRFLNFSKIYKNGFNMQFKLILNVFCPNIDKLLHISVQFYAETMTTSLSNCLKWQILVVFFSLFLLLGEIRWVLSGKMGINVTKITQIFNIHTFPGID